MGLVNLSISERVLILSNRYSAQGQKLEEVLQVSVMTVSAWRTGKRPPSKVYRDKLIAASGGLIGPEDFPEDDAPAADAAPTEKKPRGRKKKDAPVATPVAFNFDL